jgi:hypothetical protein
MTTTITQEQQDAIAAFVSTHHIPAGLGTEEEACSIAAINLCLTGQLTDDIPGCMSVVIGKWILVIQDAMPDGMRNSDEWRRLLPLAAGTGREHEKQRADILMARLWNVVLPQLQSIADKQGFGTQWKAMTIEKTPAAAEAAVAAAEAAARAAEAEAAAWAARKAAVAAAAAGAWAAAWAAREAEVAAREAEVAAWVAARAAKAAEAAAEAASWAADASAAAAPDFWVAVDPIGVLRQLVEVGND